MPAVFLHPAELLGLVLYLAGATLLVLDQKRLAMLTGGMLALFQVVQILGWSGSVDLGWFAGWDFPFMRPVPALAQLLLGLQLVLRAKEARGLWWPLLGVLAALLGMSALATALVQTTWFADWWQLVPYSTAGAVGLVALGLISVLVGPWSERWRVPLALGVVSGLLAITAGQVLRVQRGVWIEETTENVAQSTLGVLEQQMLAYTLAMRVLVGDWDDPDTPPIAGWQLDAGGAAVELAAVLDFVWIRPDGTIGWQFGPPGRAPRSAVEAARTLLVSGESIAEPHPTHVGSVVLVGLPLVIQGQRQGVMVGLFDGEQLVERLAAISPEGRQHFEMLVLLEGEPVGTLGHPDPVWHVSRSTRILDTVWTVRLSPTREWVMLVRTSLPEVFLVLGIALALALAFGTELTQETRLQARQLQRALDALQASHNVLEQRVQERTEELRLANADLTRSNQDLEQFAAVVSHDLKQPLHTVSLYLQMLERRHGAALQGEGAQWVATCRNAVRRMSHLIDELLAYARAGAATPKRERVALSRIVEDVLQALEAPIVEAGAHIEQEGLGLTVEGDPTQLALVLQNLIGNAVKYRGDAPPRVRVRAIEAPHEIRVEVEDNGPGMAPEVADRVFEMFERGATNAPGTGVGLAIARRIVERHGGQLGVHTVLGEGSTFWFTLPRSDEPRVHPRPPLPTSPRRSGPARGCS